MLRYSSAIATPDGSWCSTAFVGVLPLLVFLTNKETLTGYSEYIGIPHHRSNVYRSLPVCVLLPLLVFLTNKETFTCFSEFIGIPHNNETLTCSAFVGVPHQQSNVLAFPNLVSDV